MVREARQAALPRYAPVSQGPAHRAARRAVRNTTTRAAGEIVGKLATLVLFGVIARELGEQGMGVLVFAFAWLGIATAPVGLGMDPYLLREVARDHAAAHRLLYNVVGVKLAVTSVVLPIGVALVFVLDYDAETRSTVALLAVSMLLDLVAKSLHAILTARERSDVLSLALIAQRVLTAVGGVAVVMSGGTVVAVGAVFIVGSLLHLALAAIFVHRLFGLPEPVVDPGTWGLLTRRSAPFAIQDLFTSLLFKLDAILLSLLAAEAAVGRYGAAYRLLEATLFVTWALNSGFGAMFAYLERDSDPPLHAVFGRAIKFALVVLVPIAVLFAVEAEPLVTLVYGAGFSDAAEPLRLLAPVVVLLSLASLATILIQSQRRAGSLVPLTGAAVVVNLALNIVLIRHYEDSGAAAAMLGSEALLAGVLLWRAHVVLERAVRWRVVLASPLLAGAAMAAVMALLHAPVVAEVLVGTTSFVVGVVMLERVFSPEDLEFAVAVVRGRAGRRRTAA